MIDDNTNPFGIIIHKDFGGDVDGFLQRVGGAYHDAWRCCVVRQSASHELLKRVLPDDTTWLTLDHVWSEKTLREVEARRAAKAEAAKTKNHRNYLKAKKARAEVARTVKRKIKAAAVRKAAKKKAAKVAKPSKPKKPLHPWVRGL